MTNLECVNATTRAEPQCEPAFHEIDATAGPVEPSVAKSHAEKEGVEPAFQEIDVAAGPGEIRCTNKYSDKQERAEPPSQNQDAAASRSKHSRVDEGMHTALQAISSMLGLEKVLNAQGAACCIGWFAQEERIVKKDGFPSDCQRLAKKQADDVTEFAHAEVPSITAKSCEPSAAGGAIDSFLEMVRSRRSQVNCDPSARCTAFVDKLWLLASARPKIPINCRGIADKALLPSCEPPKLSENCAPAASVGFKGIGEKALKMVGMAPACEPRKLSENCTPAASVGFKGIGEKALKMVGLDICFNHAALGCCVGWKNQEVRVGKAPESIE